MTVAIRSNISKVLENINSLMKRTTTQHISILFILSLPLIIPHAIKVVLGTSIQLLIVSAI